MQKTHERIIVSVGGSLIVPEDIDVQFLSRFRTFILSKIIEGFSFYIIAGGGKIARHYQDAAREVRGDLPRDDLDWLGIHSTRLNGHLLRAIFREEAYPPLVKNPTRRIPTNAPVIVGAGYKPGWSTDHCAVLAAKRARAKRLVNLSNVSHVFTADPRTHADATRIEKISWPEFRKLVPSEWDPGLSTPFDPVAAREAEHLKLEVAIMSGANLDELGNYLDGKPFEGTSIS